MMWNLCLWGVLSSTHQISILYIYTDHHVLIDTAIIHDTWRHHMIKGLIYCNTLVNMYVQLWEAQMIIQFHSVCFCDKICFTNNKNNLIVVQSLCKSSTIHWLSVIMKFDKKGKQLGGKLASVNSLLSSNATRQHNAESALALGKSLSPDGTKLLPEPMLIYH